MKIMIFIILLLTIFICGYLVYLPPAKEHFLITNIKDRLKEIDEGFKQIDIRESNSSYTEDKSIIYLCLKGKDGDFYPINTLMYVTLHEIAHFLNKKDFGHTETFKKIFNRLLCIAKNKGLYQPFEQHGEMYCGVDIKNISMPECD